MNIVAQNHTFGEHLSSKSMCQVFLDKAQFDHFLIYCSQLVFNLQASFSDALWHCL